MFYFVQRALSPGALHRPVLQTEPGGDNDLGVSATKVIET